MKTILKIGLGLAAAFFIFFVGLSVGFAGGTVASIGSDGHFDRTISEHIIVERDMDRFVEEVVIEDMDGFESGMREFEIAMEELEHELEGAEVIVERNGRFGPNITVIPPVPPVPEIPAVPPVPAVPVVVHHSGPSFFGIIGGMIRLVFAIAFILIGVWLIVRRNRQPVEKSPKM